MPKPPNATAPGTSSSSSSPPLPNRAFFLFGTCGMHGALSRAQRVHGSGWRSSRSHLTLDFLHAAHARLTARMSPSQAAPSRTQRVHGRWSLQAVFARWQFLHACSLGAPSVLSSASPSPPPSLGAIVLAAAVLSPCAPPSTASLARAWLAEERMRGEAVGVSMPRVAYRLMSATVCVAASSIAASDLGSGAPRARPTSRMSTPRPPSHTAPTLPSAVSFEATSCDCGRARRREAASVGERVRGVAVASQRARGGSRRSSEVF